MGQIVVWALLTGGITGGVWTSIVLLGNQARLRKEHQSLGDDVAARRAQLARLETRLAFVESRFAVLDGAIQTDLGPSDAVSSDVPVPHRV